MRMNFGRASEVVGGGIDEHRVIDATYSGSVARMINHCCEPNCVARIVTQDGEKKIAMYSRRDIQVGRR